MSGSTLREQLIEAKLAGTKAEDGAHAYLFRSNETAAVVALDEVQRWLYRQSMDVAGYAKSQLTGAAQDAEFHLARRLRDFAKSVADAMAQTEETNR